MNAPVQGGASRGGIPSYETHGTEDEQGFLEFDLKALYLTLRKRLVLILGVTFGLTALVMAAVLQQTPLYTATAQVLLDRQKMQADRHGNRHVRLALRLGDRRQRSRNPPFPLPCRTGHRQARSA